MHSSIIRFFEYWLGQVNKMLKNEVDVIFHRDLFKTAWKVSKYVFGQNTKIYIAKLRIWTLQNLSHSSKLLPNIYKIEELEIWRKKSITWGTLQNNRLCCNLSKYSLFGDSNTPSIHHLPLAIKWHKQWLVKYLPSSSVAPNNFWIFFVSLAQNIFCIMNFDLT